MSVYLDNAATTRPCAEAVAAVETCLKETYGNPSSLHAEGVAAWRILTAARKSIAAGLSCEPECVLFTSGATESNNLALLGAARARRRRGNRIVSTAVEHPSVASALTALEDEGFEVIRVLPDGEGIYRSEDFLAAVNEDTILCSMMLVNNETGAILPAVETFSTVKRRFPAVVTHCDAVQAFGKLPLFVSRLHADLVSVSAHKLHGVKGCGALYIAKGTRILPLFHGGGQEGGLRPGTESVPLIAGFAAAVEVALPHLQRNAERALELRAYALEKLTALANVTVLSRGECSPYLLNVSVSGVRSEIMLHFLETHGVYVSSGSACAKGRKSGVLASFGHNEQAIDGALRISLSRENTTEDIDALVEGVRQGIQRFRPMGR